MPSNHLSPIFRGDDPEEPGRPSQALTQMAGARRDWPAPLDVDDDAGPGIRGYLAAIYRGKWIVLAAAVVGAGAGYLHTTFTNIVPQYGAQGSVWIQGNVTGATGPIVSQELLQAGSWMDLLVTYAVLEPVVREQRLYLRPHDADDLPLLDDLTVDEIVLAGDYSVRPVGSGAESGWVFTYEGEVVERVAPGAVLGTNRGFSWRPPPEVFEGGREVGFRLMTVRDAARQVREELITTIDARGTFLRIEYRSPSPERSAAVVNALMDRFVAVAADLKSGNLDSQVDLLDEQLNVVQAELAAAEQALQSFQIRTITLPSDQPTVAQAGVEMTRGAVFNEYFELTNARDATRRDRERLEAILATASTGRLEIEALGFVPAAAQSAQLQEARGALLSARSEESALLERLTESHPEVIAVSARIQRLEQVTIPAFLTELIAQLRAEEAQLASRVAASESNLSEIPNRTIEEARLQRNRQIFDEQYQDLRRRFQGATLARASSLPDIQVLDRALPPSEPVETVPISLALMIFLGSVGIAVAAVLLMDRIDSRIRTPDEVLSAFGIPVLGAIPRIRGSRGSHGAPTGIRNLSQVREAFRQLRTSLEYAYGSAGPMVLTISSSTMNEGKTLVTTNLGVSFAELGLRTVVVDADTRRGDIHHFLGGRRTPGLTDYLTGKVSGDDVIQETSHEGLDFIGSGTRISNSPELLSSRQMGELLAGLRKMYDVILFDSPPLGAGADPLVLGSITGHMLFVVRSGATVKDFAMAKMEPLDRLPIRIMGVVLNDYVPDRISTYRYYGSYLPGYEATSENGTGHYEEERMIAGVGVGTEE